MKLLIVRHDACCILPSMLKVDETVIKLAGNGLLSGDYTDDAAHQIRSTSFDARPV